MPIRSFSDLELFDPILKAVGEKGYETPTPIQAQAIPPLLAGRDLIGVAQTGTGKTAAFALPMLDALARKNERPRPHAPRALILTPTRELASQIHENFEEYGRHLRLRYAVIFGGVNQNPQVKKLKAGLDVLVATPGRLLDLMGQGFIRLDRVEFFVLDEADRMLDMGFIHDVKRVLRELPARRQSLLFSATMPPSIVKLAQSFLDDPVQVSVTPPSTTVERIEQRLLYVEKNDKKELLAEVLSDPEMERALVFTATKHGANRVAEFLRKIGITADAIHGNKSQGARERALLGFREGNTRALVATDIAARGIDVPGITLVVNFDLPNIAESYVHRIGRTARAGRDGLAISFCAHAERPYVRDIEKLIRQKVTVVEDHPFRSTVPMDAAPVPPPTSRGGGRPRGRGRPGGGGGGGRRPGGSSGRRRR